MHDYSYSAHLVINDGYEDRLDMTITCQNAQQLLRAKDLIADQMNAYIAEFAVQSGLTGVPSNADMMASNFMEDKDGNKKGFEWQELGAENSSNSTGQYADNPALPSDSDEPVFMEAAPC